LSFIPDPAAVVGPSSLRGGGRLAECGGESLSPAANLVVVVIVVVVVGGGGGVQTVVVVVAVIVIV
jgi:hypothetical protein